MATPKIVSLRDLAEGELVGDPEQRAGGLLAQFRSQKQNVAALANGEKSEEDLLRQAYSAALSRLEGRIAASDAVAEAASDDAYRADQEARYRSGYGWDETNVNDEVQLDNLLDLAVEMRRVRRELKRATGSRERGSLRDQLRDLGRSFGDRQTSMGIDKLAREAHSRNADPMTVLQEQIEDGAAMMQRLIDDFGAVAPTIENEGELRYMTKHHAGLPYEFIDPLLLAHRRVLGLPQVVPTD